ncbi:MAG: Mce protein [Mycobacterium sp.]
MEGDAGASRLNPPPMPIARRLRRLSRRPGRRIRQESGDEADQIGIEETTEVSEESEVEADQISTEATTEVSEESEAEADAGDAGVERDPSRLGRGWLVGIAAALLLFAGALGAGGYFALRYHHESQVIARNDAAALKAAMDCVAATQAPDTSAMAASEQKIIDCGTDAFRSQALVYTSMLVQAYQAANVHVQVSDVRAAVERNNNDGSVDVLVAMRVKVASDKSENETGYRLRAKMAFAEGQYRISKLDQVTK